MNRPADSLELLPCPFCGTEGPRHFITDDEHGRPSHGLQCVGSQCAILGPQAGSRPAAVEAWNARAPQPPAAGVVVAYRVRGHKSRWTEWIAMPMDDYMKVQSEVRGWEIEYAYSAPTPPAVPDAVRWLDEFPSLPSAAEWLDGTRGLASREWMAGWDAARNRLQTMRMTKAALSAAPEWLELPPALRRDVPDYGTAPTAAAQEGLDECADELEAAMSAAPEPVPNCKACGEPWPDYMTAKGPHGCAEQEEFCEGGDQECGPVTHHDVDGVPLCQVCWDGLLADSAPDAESQQDGQP